MKEHAWVKHLRAFRDVLIKDKQDRNAFAHETRLKDRIGTAARLANHVFSSSNVSTKNDFIAWINTVV
jgi:hypothetical protein